MNTKPIHRVVFLGSVDEGKSSLLGRLLLDTDNVFIDEFTDRDTVNLTCFTDGLRQEVKENITVDVAHRYATINKQRFVFMDAPGHIEYLNHAISAITQADSAVFVTTASALINDSHTYQARKHLEACAFFGIEKVIVAISKMDDDLNDKKLVQNLRYVANKLLLQYGLTGHVVLTSAMNGTGVLLGNSSLASLLTKIKFVQGSIVEPKPGNVLDIDVLILPSNKPQRSNYLLFQHKLYPLLSFTSPMVERNAYDIIPAVIRSELPIEATCFSQRKKTGSAVLIGNDQRTQLALCTFTAVRLDDESGRFLTAPRSL